jgi:hypothetical protein
MPRFYPVNHGGQGHVSTNFSSVVLWRFVHLYQVFFVKHIFFAKCILVGQALSKCHVSGSELSS